MALDVGNSRIGVAVTDEANFFGHPHSTVDGKKKRQAAREIASLIEQLGVTTVVIGEPLEMDGQVGAQAKLVLEFENLLHKQLKLKHLNLVEIVHFDERLTTVQAKEVLVGSGLKNSARSGALDRIAATIILEAYLERIKNSSSGV